MARLGMLLASLLPPAGLAGVLLLPAALLGPPAGLASAAPPVCAAPMQPAASARTAAPLRADVPVRAVPLATYRGILRAAERDLRAALAAERARPGSGRRVLVRLARGVPAALAVQNPAGKSMPVSLSGLRREIDAASGAAGRARADRLSTALEMVQGLRAAAEGSDLQDPRGLSAARDTLRAVLARREFRTHPTDPLMERLVAALARAVRRVLGALGDLGIPSWVARAILWAVIAAALFALVAALLPYALRLVRPAGEAGGRTARKKPSAGPAPSTVESLLAAAEDAAARGAYREGFRGVYLATLLLLDRAGHITYLESGTNWEYLRALRREAAGDAPHVFGEMTALFDDLVYGKSEVGVEEYAASLAQFRRLEVLM